MRLSGKQSSAINHVIVRFKPQDAVALCGRSDCCDIIVETLPETYGKAEEYFFSSCNVDSD